MTVKVTHGCYIDGALGYSEIDIILKLKGLLTDWNPTHVLLSSDVSCGDNMENADEIINEFTDAINESIDESQCGIWEAGDFIISDCEE